MSDSSAQRDAERAVAALYERDRASQQLGMRVMAVRPGYARVTMKVSAEMTNGHGSCHGGFLFTLSDSAFAFACNSHNVNTIAAAASIDFLSPAHLGDELTAEAKELWRSRRSGIYEITVTNQHHQRIALFRGRSHQVDGKVVEDSSAHD